MRTKNYKLSFDKLIFCHFSNPVYDPEELNWPKHDAINEYYMDIGKHMIEKHGLYLERYAVWDGLLSTSPISKSLKLLTIFVFVVLNVLN